MGSYFDLFGLAVSGCLSNAVKPRHYWSMINVYTTWTRIRDSKIVSRASLRASAHVSRVTAVCLVTPEALLSNNDAFWKVTDKVKGGYELHG